GGQYGSSGRSFTAGCFAPLRHPSLSPYLETGIRLPDFRSFSNDLYQHSLASPAIELTVKDLLPRTEIQFTVADRHHHFASHYLPFYMRICVVFSGIIVAILLDRLMRSRFFEHCLLI